LWREEKALVDTDTSSTDFSPSAATK
jgi:hypothetical protein